MDRKPSKETIKELKSHLNFLKRKFSPEKILLFGSRARKDNLKNSDFDIIVISEKFEGMGFRERISKAYGMWDKKQDLDIICYTPKEFEKLKKRIGIVQKASKEGINLIQ
ncbi:MAG: nucleotidyltransferase domain-containing protein [Candidatus Pacearchaeota archaeon]